MPTPFKELDDKKQKTEKPESHSGAFSLMYDLEQKDIL
jgi:hypothetical protein